MFTVYDTRKRGFVAILGKTAALEKHAPTIAAAHKIDEKKVSEIVMLIKEPESKVTLIATELKDYFGCILKK